MPELKLLVDTSVVVDLLGGDQAITRLLNQHGPVYVPVVVLAELFAGARNSQRVAENVEQVEAFAADNQVLDCDIETAREYGDIYSHLTAQGRRIPENDMWIAAVARQHGLPLAARDAHFDRVPLLVRVHC